MQLAVQMARAQTRYVRIVITDARQLALQQLNNFQRRRFADVIYISLIGDAENEYLGAAQRLTDQIQSVRHPFDDVGRHRGVDLSRQLDETGLEIVLPRLP